MCPAGVFARTIGASAQSGPSCGGACPIGKYCRANTSEPAICPAGHYCPRGSPAPTPCPAGSHNPLENASSEAACLICEEGFWCTGGHQVACQSDTYNPVASRDSTDQRACLPCPTGSSTNGMQSASSLGACVCKEGFYNSNASEGGVSCVTCPSGTNCGVGTALESLPVKRGYFRLNVLSLDVRRCPDAAVNCDDAPACPESTSGCRGTVNGSWPSGRRLQALPVQANLHSSAGCHDGLTGVFCRLCTPRDDGKRA